MDPDQNPVMAPQDIEALFAPQRYDPDKGCLALNVFTAILTDDKVIANPEGLSRWQPDAGDIFWFVRFANSGQLDVAMNVATDKDTAGAELEVEIAGQTLTVETPNTGGLDAFERVSLGSVDVAEAGKAKVMLRIKSAKGEAGGCLSSLELSGAAAEESEEEAVPRDIVPAILQMKEGVHYDMVYTSVTPTVSYMGTGFGICQCPCGVTLALCDTDCEGEKSISYGFGKLVFAWEIGETYHFLVRARPEGGTVTYTAYVYDGEGGNWKPVGQSSSEGEELLEGPACLLAQSYGHQQGYFPREALYGPMWARVPGGDWEELNEATFGFAKYPNAIDNGDVTVEGCRFRVRTGGDTEMSAQPGPLLTAGKSDRLPDILEDIESKLPE